MNDEIKRLLEDLERIMDPSNATELGIATIKLAKWCVDNGGELSANTVTKLRQLHADLMKS